METEPGTTRLSVIGISWLTAAIAAPLALIGAVLGQAAGALVGGCHWIGFTVPLDRQIWALVNQPVLNFSSLPDASGYWLGSMLLPLVTGAAVIGFLPRARSLVAELGSVQVAWAMSAISVAWLPLLDPTDGHLARYLALNNRPPGWIWLAPALACAVALLPTLRLLEMARRHRPNISRGSRVLVVALHLGAPAVAFAGVVSIVRGTVPLRPVMALALPLAAALLFAWFRYPAPYVHPLQLPGTSQITALAAAAIFLSAGVWLAGRPLPDGKSAGFLWGPAHSFNNIRPWIEPISISSDVGAD
jgi:hypothetical protein